MKLFIIITGASNAFGRAFGQALCDESLGITHLRAFLVDENQKALQSTGSALMKKALTCKALLGMYQMDIHHLSKIDSQIDDLLIEMCDKFDKVLLVHAGGPLGPIAPLLQVGSVEGMREKLTSDNTNEEESTSVGPSWTTWRFIRHVQAHKLAKKATVVHLSKEENAAEETSQQLPVEAIHHPCDFNMDNYEQACASAKVLAERLIQVD